MRKTQLAMLADFENKEGVTSQAGGQSLGIKKGKNTDALAEPSEMNAALPI